jgi:hypothetical protein
MNRQNRINQRCHSFAVTLEKTKTPGSFSGRKSLVQQICGFRGKYKKGLRSSAHHGSLWVDGLKHPTCGKQPDDIGKTCLGYGDVSVRSFLYNIFCSEGCVFFSGADQVQDLGTDFCWRDFKNFQHVSFI